MFKRIFSSAVLSSHYECIFIYMCTVITFSIKPTMPSEEKKKKRKKESEDIERSIGRTTALLEDMTSKRKRGETEEMRRSNCCYC